MEGVIFHQLIPASLSCLLCTLLGCGMFCFDYSVQSDRLNLIFYSRCWVFKTTAKFMAIYNNGVASQTVLMKGYGQFSGCRNDLEP